ncbi:MAG: NUDIX domain-containing protein [Burkholderiaceae bacterium]|jgi:NADH pyrophosphatase NudC (nudix superfamily)|nr:NUDIX domain-containing protein [Burkholderiaceae bacterium]
MSAPYRFCPLCATPLQRQWHGERERDACPACGWVHWDNPAPVVAALIELDGKVLLARNRDWPEKMYALVTGFLERDETPRQAVEREVAEETGLATRAAALIGVYDFTRKNEVIIAYHVEAEGQVRLGEELVDYRMIEPARLRPWPLGTGLAMADWMRARGLPVEFLPMATTKT